MKVRKFKLIMTIKTFLILFALGFSVFIFAGNVKSNSVSTKYRSESKNKSKAINQNSGGSIYRTHCIRCHGGDGRSKTARGKRKGATDLTKSRISYSRGIRVIRNGRSLMPGFRKELSAGQIKKVNSYVRKFRK